MQTNKYFDMLVEGKSLFSYFIFHRSLKHNAYYNPFYIRLVSSNDTILQISIMYIVLWQAKNWNYFNDNCVAGQRCCSIGLKEDLQQ